MTAEQEQQVTYEVLAVTEDTDDPVLRVMKGESYMDVILDTEGDSVNVWYVRSEQDGDMKVMLDHLLDQLSTNEVRFLSPLDDEHKKVANNLFEEMGLPNKVKFGEDGDYDNIAEHLEGFERVVKEHGDKSIEMLVGEWDVGE